MKKEDFTKLVENNFSILITRYGFSIVHSRGPGSSGDYTVVLESGDCRIKIWTEKGFPLISVGLRYAPYHYKYPGQWADEPLTKWYNIWYVTSYLTNGKDNWTYPKPTTPSDDWGISAKKQMEELASLLRTILGENHKVSSKNVNLKTIKRS